MKYFYTKQNLLKTIIYILSSEYIEIQNILKCLQKEFVRSFWCGGSCIMYNTSSLYIFFYYLDKVISLACMMLVVSDVF